MRENGAKLQRASILEALRLIEPNAGIAQSFAYLVSESVRKSPPFPVALELRETVWLRVAFRRESDRRENFFSGRVREWGSGLQGGGLVWVTIGAQEGHPNLRYGPIT